MQGRENHRNISSSSFVERRFRCYGRFAFRIEVECSFKNIAENFQIYDHTGVPHYFYVNIDAIHLFFHKPSQTKKKKTEIVQRLGFRGTESFPDSGDQSYQNRQYYAEKHKNGF